MRAMKWRPANRGKRVSDSSDSRCCSRRRQALADTCEHGAHGVEGVEDFNVLHGSVVGDEVEAPWIGNGVRVCARLERVVNEEAFDGAICSDGDEGGGGAVAMASSGQKS
jgi:hypothetical protein